MNSKLLVLASAVVLLFSGLIVTIITPRPRSHLLPPGSDGWLEAIPIEGAFGPESFTFSPQGDGPYTGVSDGRIIKWVEEERRWVDFAYTSPNRYELRAPPFQRFRERLFPSGNNCPRKP